MKKSLLKCLKRHSPVILSCLAATGVIGTVVMAVKATPKVQSRIREAENVKSSKLTKRETVVVAGAVYLPSVLMGVATILCIIGSNILSRKQQASLISAYALLDESYKSYKNAAKTVYGEEADVKITAEVAKDVYVSASGMTVYDSNWDDESEKKLFYDSYSKRYFTSTFATVISALYHINRNLALRGYVPINEFYEFLGVEKVEHGDCFGWIFNDLVEQGLLWLDFENYPVEFDDGLECYIVSSTLNPTFIDEDKL